MVYCHSCNVTCFSNRCQWTVAPRYRMIVDKTCWSTASIGTTSGNDSLTSFQKACPSRGLVRYQDARQWVRRCVRVEDSSVIVPGRKAVDYKIRIVRVTRTQGFGSSDPHSVGLVNGLWALQVGTCFTARLTCYSIGWEESDITL